MLAPYAKGLKLRRPQMHLADLPEAAALLLGPGGAYETVEEEIDGSTFRIFRHAPKTLGDLYQAALEHADAEFYVFEDERYTFGEAWVLAQQVAASLQQMGVKPGDRVGIALRNYPEWVWAFMGITSMGAIAVAMNAWWTGEEMLYGIDDSGLGTIFVDGERLQTLQPYLDERSLNVVAIRAQEHNAARVQSWTAFLQLGSEFNPTLVEPDDPATLLYTSGSTAQPKGVVSTHRATIHALLGWQAAAALAAAVAEQPPPVSTHQPSMILTVPLFHVTGLNVQLLSSFRYARKLVGMYKWDADLALSIVEQERITQFNGVPTMAWEMVQSPNYAKHDLSSLLSMGGGGAAMAPEHSRQIADRSKGSVTPGTGYGMTETNGLATAIGGPDLLERPLSCGRALAPIVDVKIVDHEGNEVAKGVSGEIWIHGAMNFTGYWNNPVETAATLTDGWVHTGDIGHLDEDDFLFITDREKDMIIRGGENIGCQEVEAIIYDHPNVSECAVFGVPDERLGEIVAAVVMPKPGAGLTAADVQSHVAEHAAKFKVPAHVWIQPEQLPRIASGKIFKRGLKTDAIARLRVD